MSAMKELYTELGEPIQIAARRASANWYGLLEPEEIESELWIEILESDATEGKLGISDPDLLIDLLVRMAERICIKERDNYEHYSGNYRYSVNEIKEIAEQYFVRSGEDIVEEHLDFQVAYDSLMSNPDDVYADSIFRRYAVGEIPKSGSDKMRLSRGLTKLANLMNRNFKQREYEYDNGPETRVPTGTRYRG